MPTFAQLSNIPRNNLLGTFADLLQAGKDNTGVVGDFLLGQAPETLNNMSYGFNPTRGKGMTYGMKPEAADLANVIPTASLAGILGKSYAKFAGKQIAKQVQNGTGMLGRNMMNPRMNIFMGESSKTFDTASHAKALQMAKNGIDERKIWTDTGNFIGADGKWRQEISDHNVTSNPTTPNSVGEYSLSDILNNNNALAAYPQLRNIGVKTDKKTYFSPKDNEIASSEYTNQSVLNKHYQHQENRIYKIADKLESTGLNSANAEKRLQSMLDGIDPKASSKVDGYIDKTSFNPSPILHEQQHAIQGIENWNQGGSPFKERLHVNDFIKSEIDKLDNSINDLSAQYSNTFDDSILNKLQSERAWKSKYQDTIENPHLNEGVISDFADKSYRNLAGEAEARATQARMNMTLEQRRNVFPFDSYDVPREKLIVRGVQNQANRYDKIEQWLNNRDKK